MADLKSDTSELLANESKEDNESPLSQRAYLSCDANSDDSNKTLVSNLNNNNMISIDNSKESVTIESNINNINNNTNNSEMESIPDWKESDRSEASVHFSTINRPFFTLPRLLSGRRKRIKRKGIIPNECSVSRIEEQPESDTHSIGQLSTSTTTTYRNSSNIYVKENFFIRLMRHLASPVHGGHGGGGGVSGAHTPSPYYSNESNGALRRRSKGSSLMSSASNGDISRCQALGEQNDQNCTNQRSNHSSNNGYEMPAVCGIKNHGNTCFMNAIIQCLCNTDLLAEYFVMNHYRIDLLRHNKLHARKYGTKGEVTEQLALLLKSLWSCMYSSEISNKFKILVAKYGNQYEGSEQHDAQEFLLWLLDKCHEDLNIANKKKYKKIKSLSQYRTDELIAAETLANHMRCNSSFIHDLFQAQLRSSLVCRSCGKHSNTFDPYLCLSLPVPTRLTHTLIVNSVYLNKTPREVKIGVSIESLATLRELRDKISRLLKIPEKQLVLLLIGQEFGLKELVKDTDIIQEILEDMENIFAVETPKLPQIHANSNSIPGLSNNSGEQMLTLVWANRIGIGSQGKIFGSLFSTLVSREASYKQIQLDILNSMRSIIKHYSDISISNSLSLRLRVIGGIAGKCYLPEDVDHPLYMPTVDRALTGTEDKEYRGPVHLKLVVEWDLDVRQSLLIDDDQMESPKLDSSIEFAKARSQKTNRATLQDCFDMYFKEERLAADNAWICPSCKRRQQCTKKLSLWSVPDIFIIHLKRFRQSSNSQRSKLTTLILFPQNGLEMSTYIAPRYVQQTNGTLNNTLPSLWSPWKRPRMFGKLARSDDNTYDLYAVCNHNGNMQSGHYTAYCRNPIDSCWYLFDDTKVVPVQESSIITSDAYILFYHRSSLSSALSSCASSSTSGYSSSASSYYSDHWAFRMPPFNYWPPKSSKSQDNLSSDTINERNCAKSESTATPPTRYASLPSRSTQNRHKMSNNYKTLETITNPSNETQSIAQNDELKTVETRNQDLNSSLNTNSNNNNSNNNSNNSSNESSNNNNNDLDKNVSPVMTQEDKYWAVTSV